MQQQDFLILSKRFLPLFITQLLGAFNDNLFKSALIILIGYELAPRYGFNGPLFITIASGLFILPFFLFSAIAGQLADRYDKARLIRLTKLLEVILAVIACIGFYFDNVYFLLLVLFLLGAQSAFFGPLKYGILPDYLAKNELISANAWLGAGTFLAILIGTISGSLLILSTAGRAWTSGLMLLCAVTGWLSSLYLRATIPGTAEQRISANILSSTFDILRHALANREIVWAMWGISWFWWVGATWLAQITNYVQIVVHGNEQIVTVLLTAFTVGIGLGALLCNLLLKGKITARYAPWAAVGISLFSLDFYWVSSQLPVIDSSAELLSALDFLQNSHYWRILLDLTLLAACGGLYIVPLSAMVQNLSLPDYRARNIAGLNILNAFMMVLSAVVSAIWLSQGYSVLTLLLWVGLLNVGLFFGRAVSRMEMPKK